MFKDKESEVVKDLRAHLRDQQKVIFELKEEKSHREREKTLSIKEARMEMKQSYIEQHKELRGEKNDAERARDVAQARVELLQKQMDTAPYKVVSDLMKALMVKLPNIDIKNLSVTAKEKE